MAGLYGRVAARGFPSQVAEGLTGAGALAAQGAPPNPAHGQAVAAHGQFTTLPSYTAGETPPPPVVDLLEGFWGLGGQVTDPDQTPRTHAAPVPGWAGSYTGDEQLLIVNENANQIHSEDFGGVGRRMDLAGMAEPAMSAWTANTPGQNVLEPVTGQLQYMGGFDRTQGYSLSNNYGFDAGHIERLTLDDKQPFSYLDPGERPFIVPQASGSFTPTDAVQGPGPATSMLDAAELSATPPSAYQPPPATPVLPGPQPGGAASAGWWS